MSLGFKSRNTKPKKEFTRKEVSNVFKQIGYNDQEVSIENMIKNRMIVEYGEFRRRCV